MECLITLTTLTLNLCKKLFLFWGLGGLDSDIGNWDTSNAKMDGMFYVGFLTMIYQTGV